MKMPLTSLTVVECLKMPLSVDLLDELKKHPLDWMVFMVEGENRLAVSPPHEIDVPVWSAFLQDHGHDPDKN